MKRCTFALFAAFALLLTMSVPASAQETIPVCIQVFEGLPGVQYLTEEQIAEIEAIVEDPQESAPPKVVGYPDPATGSCATENGELLEYDPEFSTPICVPSGADGNGPLVVQFVFTHYLPAVEDPIFADPETGSCVQEETTEDETTPDESESGTDTDENTGSGTNTAADTASELPNTGTGTVATSNDLAAMLGFASVSALLFVAGVRFSRRA